jgi:hypothetical protein
MLIVTYKPLMLSVVMLNVIMLSVVMLDVVMLNFIMLSVVAPLRFLIVSEAGKINLFTEVKLIPSRGKLECLSLSISSVIV